MFVLYTETTTCHGLGYLFRQDASRVRRVVWFAFYLASFSVWATYSINAVLLYTSYPVSSSIQQHYVDSMEYPELTFCNVNRLKKSFVMPLIENNTIPDFRSIDHYIGQQITLGNVNISTINVNFTGRYVDDKCFFSNRNLN